MHDTCAGARSGEEALCEAREEAREEQAAEVCDDRRPRPPEAGAQVRREVWQPPLVSLSVPVIAIISALSPSIGTDFGPSLLARYSDGKCSDCSDSFIRFFIVAVSVCYCHYL
jgi:hypothetical protein